MKRRGTCTTQGEGGGGNNFSISTINKKKKSPPAPALGTDAVATRTRRQQKKNAMNMNVKKKEKDCVVRKLWLCPSSSTGRSRSIQEIYISKNGNVLEYKPTNKKTSPSNNIVQINGKKWTDPPIHPVTDTNSNQSRPRHFTTPEMIKHLDPICLDRTIGLHKYNDGRIFESFADVVRVTFDSNGCTNHVLYASNSSRNNHLKDAYQLWNEYEEELRRLLNTVPLEALIRDELAGGCYGEYIFAGI